MTKVAVVVVIIIIIRLIIITLQRPRNHETPPRNVTGSPAFKTPPQFVETHAARMTTRVTAGSSRPVHFSAAITAVQKFPRQFRKRGRDLQHGRQHRRPFGINYHSPRPGGFAAICRSGFATALDDV